MSDQIHFNGKTYAGIEEMPPEIRRAYEQLIGIFSDKDGDGMPDVLQGLASANAPAVNLQSSMASIVYNGQIYRNLDELPPEARQRYEQAMAKIDANRNGIPDFMEWMTISGGASLTGTEPRTPKPASGKSASVSHPTVEAEGFRGGWLIAAVIVIALICMGTIGILALLRQ